MCIVAVTGHRPEKLGDDYDYTSPLVAAIREDMKRILVNKGCTLAICGMALGIDTVFALLALELHIPLMCVIPFKGQETRWPPKSQQIYNEILKQAFDIVCLYENKTEKLVDNLFVAVLLQERNQFMVNQLIPPNDYLIGVWDGSKGGTRNCMKYAYKHLPQENIIRINPNDYRSILTPQGKLF